MKLLKQITVYAKLVSDVDNIENKTPRISRLISREKIN